MNNIQLKSCPFCKGKARITKWLHGFWPVADHRGWCPLNDMRPPEFGFYVSPETAARAWNMRDGE